MPATIHAAEYPIEKILSDDYVFTIPKYQRPYAWTTENAGLLLDDLISAMGDSSQPVERMNPYFLGSIVLIKGDSPISEIVDGQQRITTLTILLSVLRATVPQQFAENFTIFLYEKGNLLRGTQDRFRLTLRERDAQFFRDYIQKEGGLEKLATLTEDLTSSQRNIRDNALYFLSRILELPENERIRLAMFIITRCYLVVVRTPDFDSAYRIFSVLNDRGLDLTHSDILKAEIIGQIPESKQEAYTKKWEDIEDQLGRENFKELFAHIRMIYRKRKLEKTILEEVRKYVNPSHNPEDFIDNVLIPMSDSMFQILTASYESSSKADEINQYLKLLLRVDNFDWLPPTIFFMSKYQNQPDKLLKFLILMERLAMGLMIRRANINERIERYGRLLHAIENNEDLYSEESPLQLTSSECDEILKVLDGDLYTITKIRVPVLLRLDEYLAGGTASYNYKTITVEHVLPQNPKDGSQWITWFPDKEQRDKTVHRLGNLVLLSRNKNAQASNFDFDRKKQEYFIHKGVSPFALTTQVIQESEWTPEVVERRQKLLIQKFKEIWNL
jgi:hypothetical protein